MHGLLLFAVRGQACAGALTAVSATRVVDGDLVCLCCSERFDVYLFLPTRRPWPQPSPTKPPCSSGSRTVPLHYATQRHNLNFCRGVKLQFWDPTWQFDSAVEITAVVCPGLAGTQWFGGRRPGPCVSYGEKIWGSCTTESVNTDSVLTFHSIFVECFLVACFRYHII